MKKIILMFLCIIILVVGVSCYPNDNTPDDTAEGTSSTDENNQEIIHEFGEGEYLQSVYIYTYDVTVENDTIEYHGAICWKDYAFSGYIYTISEDTLCIQPLYIDKIGAGKDSPEEIKIKIQDNQIKNINQIVVGKVIEEASYIDYSHQILWDRENGFLGLEGAPGMGSHFPGELINPYVINVEDDQIFYQGIVVSSASMFSGFSYRISGDALYIHIEFNYGQYFSFSEFYSEKYYFKCVGDGGFVHEIGIQDERIRDINRIYLGREEDESKQLIWERE